LDRRGDPRRGAAIDDHVITRLGRRRCGEECAEKPEFHADRLAGSRAKSSRRCRSGETATPETRLPAKPIRGNRRARAAKPQLTLVRPSEMNESPSRHRSFSEAPFSRIGLAREPPVGYTSFYP